jgi:hypothetical protein
MAMSCRQAAEANLYAPARADAIRMRRHAQNATPCPPPLGRTSGGHPQFFFHFSLTMFF